MTQQPIWSKEFWVDADGNHPEVFTVITAEDVRNGKWKPKFPHQISQSDAVDYVKRLSAEDIWPVDFKGVS